MTMIKPYKDITLNGKWDSGSNSMVPESLIALKEGSTLNNLVLAFILAENGVCEPVWGGYPDYDVEKWGKKAIEDFQKHGGAATISFGGAAGTPLESVCHTVPSLVSAISKVINSYNVHSLDFDIEGGNLSNQAGIENLAKAIRQLQQTDPNLQISLTLPALTTGLTPEGLNAVQIFKNHNVNFVTNIMAMDYGSWAAPNVEEMGNYAIAAIDATHQQIQTLYPQYSSDYIWRHMLAVTPMIGVNDVWHYPENRPERFTLQDARKVSHYASQKGFEIRYWSMDRDVPCDQKYASAVCSGTADGKRLQDNKFDFAKAFKTSALLGLALTNQLINITNTMSQPLVDSSSSSDSQSEGYDLVLGAEIIGAMALTIAAMSVTALAAKKYGHHVANCLKAPCSFFGSKPAHQAPSEEDALRIEPNKNYSTFV